MDNGAKGFEMARRSVIIADIVPVVDDHRRCCAGTKYPLLYTRYVFFDDYSFNGFASYYWLNLHHIEVEGIVKNLTMTRDHDKITVVINLLTHEYMYSPQANQRKEWLTSLDATTVGMSSEAHNISRFG
ncbi:putative vacuole morphology and inheritance protein [Helianthus anomalus]